MSSFQKKLQELVTLNPISTPGRAIELLEGYFNLSIHWGQKINITNNLKVDDYILENLMDPVNALQGTQNNLVGAMEGGITDVGCGGGYVGMTWAIVEPRLQVRLVDADRKKINFCKQVIRELGLSERVTAEQARVEDLRNLSGLVCSRATWGVDGFFELLDRVAVPGCVGVYLGGFDESQRKSGMEILPYQVHPVIKRRAVFIRKS